MKGVKEPETRNSEPAYSKIFDFFLTFFILEKKCLNEKSEKQIQ
jgi:hypothetical protein